MVMNRDRRIARMSWDVYQQPDLDQLDAILRELSYGAVRLHQVDTGTPRIEIIISDTDLDDEHIAAAHAWNPDTDHPLGIFTIPADAHTPAEDSP